MQTLHFSIHINAPREKVWDTMLNKETYLEWTDIFNPSGESSFEGSWEQGSDIRFIGTSEDGTIGGMISRIKENRPYERLAIQHLGEFLGDKEKFWTAKELEGKEALEVYTFEEKDGGTDLFIDLDTNDQLKDMFEDMWPKALEKLKELAEKE